MKAGLCLIPQQKHWRRAIAAMVVGAVGGAVGAVGSTAGALGGMPLGGHAAIVERAAI